MEVTQQRIIQLTIEDENIDMFLCAISKLYQRINAIGFDHLGLTKGERFIFNEFVEQVAINNQQDNG